MSTIEKEIIELRKSLLRMFLLVENQWEKGSNAILNYDQDAAEAISSSEKRINAQELKIDSECENIIALHSPVAIDLRFILTSYKINHALEHIADLAESVAQYVANNDIKYDKEILKELEIPHMLDTFNFMMDYIISAFENKDSKIAEKVFKKDKMLNNINNKAPEIISKYILTHDKNMLLYILSTTRKIERAGDSLKKIAEEIIYHLEANKMKHTK